MGNKGDTMKRILVVDDVSINLRTVEKILKDQYRLSLAKSGEQALELLGRVKIDLVLLDLCMPETLWVSRVKEFGPLIVSIDTEGRNLFEENKVVFNEKGSSMIKEFEPGFQDALKQTLVKIPVSNPTTTVNKIAETTFTEPIKKELQDAKEAILQTSNVVRYSNGTRSVQKIQIDNSQFILVDGNSSVPFATLKSTTKEGVFRVKLGSGESTIGYYENANIVIEMPKANGDYIKEVFAAK